MDKLWDDVVNACKEGDKIAVDFMIQEVAKTKAAVQCMHRCLKIRVGEIEWEENEVDLKDMLWRSPSLLKNQLDDSDRSGWTLMHFACHCGCTLTLKLLLGLGANPLKRNLAGLLPSDLCQGSGSNKGIIDDWIFWKKQLDSSHQRAKNLPKCLQRRGLNSLEVSYSHELRGVGDKDQTEINTGNNSTTKKTLETCSSNHICSGQDSADSHEISHKSHPTIPSYTTTAMFTVSETYDKMLTLVNDRLAQNTLLKKFIHKDDEVIQALCIARRKEEQGKTGGGVEDENDSEDDGQNIQSLIGTIEKKTNNTMKNLKDATLERGMVVNHIHDLKKEYSKYAHEYRRYVAAAERRDDKVRSLQPELEELMWEKNAALDAFPEKVTPVKERLSSLNILISKLTYESDKLKFTAQETNRIFKQRIKSELKQYHKLLKKASQVYASARQLHAEAKALDGRLPPQYYANHQTRKNDSGGGQTRATKTKAEDWAVEDNAGLKAIHSISLRKLEYEKSQALSKKNKKKEVDVEDKDGEETVLCLDSGGNFSESSSHGLEPNDKKLSTMFTPPSLLTDTIARVSFGVNGNSKVGKVSYEKVLFPLCVQGRQLSIEISLPPETNSMSSFNRSSTHFSNNDLHSVQFFNETFDPLPTTKDGEDSLIDLDNCFLRLSLYIDGGEFTPKQRPIILETKLNQGQLFYSSPLTHEFNHCFNEYNEDTKIFIVVGLYTSRLTAANTIRSFRESMNNFGKTSEGGGDNTILNSRANKLLKQEMKEINWNRKIMFEEQGNQLPSQHASTLMNTAVSSRDNEGEDYGSVLDTNKIKLELFKDYTVEVKYEVMVSLQPEDPFPTASLPDDHIKLKLQESIRASEAFTTLNWNSCLEVDAMSKNKTITAVDSDEDEEEKDKQERKLRMQQNTAPDSKAERYGFYHRKNLDQAKAKFNEMSRARELNRSKFGDIPRVPLKLRIASRGDDEVVESQKNDKLDKLQKMMDDAEAKLKSNNDWASKVKELKKQDKLKKKMKEKKNNEAFSQFFSSAAKEQQKEALKFALLEETELKKWGGDRDLKLKCHTKLNIYNPFLCRAHFYLLIQEQQQIKYKLFVQSLKLGEDNNNKDIVLDEEYMQLVQLKQQKVTEDDLNLHLVFQEQVKKKRVAQVSMYNYVLHSLLNFIELETYHPTSNSNLVGSVGDCQSTTATTNIDQQRKDNLAQFIHDLKTSLFHSSDMKTGNEQKATHASPSSSLINFRMIFILQYIIETYFLFSRRQSIRKKLLEQRNTTKSASSSKRKSNTTESTNNVADQDELAIKLCQDNLYAFKQAVPSLSSKKAMKLLYQLILLVCCGKIHKSNKHIMLHSFKFRPRPHHAFMVEQTLSNNNKPFPSDMFATAAGRTAAGTTRETSMQVGCFPPISYDESFSIISQWVLTVALASLVYDTSRDTVIVRNRLLSSTKAISKKEMLRVPTEAFSRLLWRLDICRRRHFHALFIPLNMPSDATHSFSTTTFEDEDEQGKETNREGQVEEMNTIQVKTMSYCDELNADKKMPRSGSETSAKKKKSSLSSMFEERSINHISDVNQLLRAQADMLKATPGSESWLTSKRFVENYRRVLRENALLSAKNSNLEHELENDGVEEEEDENNDYDEVYARLSAHENEPTNHAKSLHKKCSKNLTKVESNQIIFNMNKRNQDIFLYESSKLLLNSFLFQDQYDDAYDSDESEEDDDFDELSETSRNKRGEIAMFIARTFLEATCFVRSF